MGTLRLSLLGAAGVFALVMGLAATPAEANRRVIVLEVEGSRTGGLEKSLRGIVAERNEVVPARTYRVTARKLGARSRAPKHVARVAARLDADAVVDSELERHRRGYMLRIRVLDGDDGRVIKKLAVSLSNRTLSPRLQRKLAGKIDQAVAEATRGARAKKAVATKQRREKNIARQAPPPKKTARQAPPPKKTARQAPPPKKAARQAPPPKQAARQAPPPKKVARQPPPPKQAAKNEKVARKEAPRKKPRSIDDEPFDMEETFDDRGNVIDDEVPAALRR